MTVDLAGTTLFKDVKIQYSHCTVCSEICCKVPALTENESSR